MAKIAMSSKQVLDALGIDFEGFTPDEIVIRLNGNEAEIEFYNGMIINTGGCDATKEEKEVD